MSATRTGWLIGGMAVVFASCGGGTDPLDVTLQDLVGEWLAHEWVYTNAADPGETYNVITEGGLLRFAISETGTYSGYATVEGDTESLIGAVTVANGVVTMTEASDPSDVASFSLELDGNWLTLRDDDTFFEHFPSAPGSDVAASVMIRLQRT